MDTPADGNRGMISIMDNLSSLQGVSGFNPDGQGEDMDPLPMPPNFDAAAANRAAAAASMSAKPMPYNNFLGKPKRPLSAYNIFFKHEREKLVSNAPDTPVTLESLKVDPVRKPKKRRHRKSHGKIGFADLARTIAEKWKTLDAESRKVFEACASKEKERYQREIKEWKAYKKTEAAADEAAAKNQIAMSHADLLYGSRGMMDTGLNNRDLADMRSLESSGWSSRAMNDGAAMMSNNQASSYQDQSSSMAGAQDPRDYLKITQQVIDMARASLSLPLFANLGRTGIMDDSTAMSLLGEQQQQQQPSFSMGGTQSSGMLRSNNMEFAGLSNGALLNVPFGNNNMSALDSDSFYQNQLMQSLDSNIQGYLNQTTQQQLRDELETRAFLNQPMQYHQAELDSGPQDYSDYGQSAQDQGLNALRNQVARQADSDELVNMINASLKGDHFQYRD